MLASDLAGLYHAGGPRRLSLYQIAQIINRVGGYDPEAPDGLPAHRSRADSAARRQRLDGFDASSAQPSATTPSTPGRSTKLSFQPTPNGTTNKMANPALASSWSAYSIATRD